MQILKLQDGKCLLCEKPINVNKTGATDYVLDHWHFGKYAGQVRGVLHRHCNRSESKVFQAVESWGSVGRDVDGVVAFLKNLINHYEKEPYPYIYHLHKTPQELKDDRNKKARQARARKAAQARVKA